MFSVTLISDGHGRGGFDEKNRHAGSSVGAAAKGARFRLPSSRPAALGERRCLLHNCAMALRRGCVPALTLVLAVLASGCVGSSSRYARYQDRGAALKATDAMLAAIPQFPNAHLLQRRDDATTYRVRSGHEIEAKPYARVLDYDVPAGHSGGDVQRWFRAVLTARRWRCLFNRRVRGVPYGFSCTSGGREIGAYIADDGHYELDASADTRPAPIATVATPGD
jgi:hypothetical protein